MDQVQDMRSIRKDTIPPAIAIAQERPASRTRNAARKRSSAFSVCIRSGSGGFEFFTQCGSGRLRWGKLRETAGVILKRGRHTLVLSEDLLPSADSNEPFNFRGRLMFRPTTCYPGITGLLSDTHPCQHRLLFTSCDFHCRECLFFGPVGTRSPVINNITTTWEKP